MMSTSMFGGSIPTDVSSKDSFWVCKITSFFTGPGKNDPGLHNKGSGIFVKAPDFLDRTTILEVQSLKLSY